MARKDLLDYLKKELIGPKNGPDELLDETPLLRYTTGIIFPQQVKVEDEEDNSGSSDSEPVDDPVNYSNQLMPSSVGLSFMTEGKKLIIETSAAAYEFLESESQWSRIQLGSPENPVTWNIDISEFTNSTIKPVFGERAYLHIKKRQLDKGNLYTVTLVNKHRSETSAKKAENCLFQVSLECKSEDSTISEYPTENSKFLDEEEQELEVIYRKKRTYAIGHGCSAIWSTKSKEIKGVGISYIPSFEIKPLTYEIEGIDDILDISFLADEKYYNENLYKKMDHFASNYEKWISELPAKNDDISQDLSDAKNRIIKKLESTADRIREGVELIKSDPLIRKAFAKANLAMLIQMHRSKPGLGGKRKPLGQASHNDVDYSTLKGYKWRPFQLAFSLLTLESLVNEDSDFRDNVDLIWFPTGGGKTEAYLLSASVIILYRRLLYKDEGAGTAVITRYTLRLLTVQQFERTSRLVCALESIRSTEPETYGHIPVTIGIWVGKASTPNQFKTAKSRVDALYEEEEPQSPFLLNSCPWCGTELVPKVKHQNPDTYGVRASENNFELFCPDSKCLFHNKLPIQPVDEGLYQQPPTILIGTVDKFALLAWDARNRVFLGTDRFCPPSLIIQDELHLLSGPLGTISGIYESAINTVLKYKGASPKVVASTATIRNANSQTTGLFGSQANVFPPSGLDEADSYFMRKDKNKMGRLYAGVLSQSESPSTSFIRTTAALLQGVKELYENGDLTPEEYDAYYTLVAYHNSLRELGKTITFARDDIPDRIGVIKNNAHDERIQNPEDVVELTSNLNDVEIPKNLAKLSKNASEPDAVGFVACTNMFSVGVDIQRLGLMVVNGQPKTTSEYIQSSSRVGRGKTPGLVISHYAATKPRDRSHYESFLPYHSKIYRFVEPTSVTPFSNPARNRALHAALVILCRHGLGIYQDSDAHKILDNTNDLDKIVDIYLEYVSGVNEKELENTKDHLFRLIDEWKAVANREGSRLVYNTYDRNETGLRRLLIGFNDKGDGWKTLYSMRNVDEECKITISGVSQN
jgi:hypothetical protein